MKAFVKWCAIAAGGVAVAAALVPTFVYLASEAMIVRRYTLPSSIVHAATAPQDLADGARLLTIFGCRDCHGADLGGRVMRVAPGLVIAAPNLRDFTRRYTDADFDRAVRRGLTPDARAIWVMPSQSYVYLRNSDLAALIGAIRALPPVGRALPPPQFGFRARLAVLAGTLQPVDPYDLGQHPPRNVGPRYEGGLYLAAMACSGCHATDLTGTPAAPDLMAVAGYSRTQFFALLHAGRAPAGHAAPEMARLAGARFHDLRDYEIDALYAYLLERAKTINLEAAH